MYRFAISPTRDMQIEDLKIALFNYICARKKGERFIIRIEDIDKTKNIEDKDREILDILAIFGLDYDSLHYQSDNFKYHLQFASTFLDEKKAFICFCSEDELKRKKEEAKKQNIPYTYDGTCENISSQEILESRKPFVIRVKKPTKEIEFNDTIKGKLKFSPEDLDSFVIMGTDKYPTSCFANGIDDMLQGITDIIKNETDLPNTPREIYIRSLVGYHEEIGYTHIPSLKQNAPSIKQLLDDGYMPESITNYLISLYTQTPKEIFSLKEAIEWFDISLVSSSKPFDIEKLKKINTRHIELLDDVELAKRLGYAGANVGKIAKLYTKYVSTTKDIKVKIDKIFSPKEVEDRYKEDFVSLKNIVLNSPRFDEFEEFEKYVLKNSALEEKLFSLLLEQLLKGSEKGPKLSELYPLIKDYLKEIAR